MDSSSNSTTRTCMSGLITHHRYFKKSFFHFRLRAWSKCGQNYLDFCSAKKVGFLKNRNFDFQSPFSCYSSRVIMYKGDYNRSANTCRGRWRLVLPQNWKNLQNHANPRQITPNPPIKSWPQKSKIANKSDSFLSCAYPLRQTIELSADTTNSRGFFKICTNGSEI